MIEKYQVGGVRFLKQSEPENTGPTFLILIEVHHRSEDLVYLLDFVQRRREGLLIICISNLNLHSFKRMIYFLYKNYNPKFREERNCGHLGLYKRQF